ncbi:MAG TPA: hypothetical protein VGA69_10025 [Nitriliruptorales bacterium]
MTSEDDRAEEPPGRRAAIVVAHWVTIGISALVALIALLSAVLGDGPRGSRPLGLALAAVAGVTVGVAWSSLRTFVQTDRPRLLWMGLVGATWMVVVLVAPAVVAEG